MTNEMNDEYANNKIIHGYCLLLISAFFRGLTSQEINSDHINHVPKLEYRIIIIFTRQPSRYLHIYVSLVRDAV